MTKRTGDQKKDLLGEPPEFEMSSEDAQKEASPYKMGSSKPPKEDPFEKDIDPSLLSADHIAMYVSKTGMIAPFTSKGSKDKKSRLKAASYEGRIGNCAYKYQNGSNTPESFLGKDDDSLCFPANSIVFVECDVEFRLPPFIAVRFNLQIHHVHRGLLLGTGPLVDPGFWGKLCIPIHNLTDEDYWVPRDEGLIWIEFTKTTSNPKLGRPPTDTELWDIKRSLDKASSPYDFFVEKYKNAESWRPALRESQAPNQKVGIRSSIQTAYEELKKDAQNAANDAKEANRAVRSIKTITVAAGVAIIIAVAGLVITYYLDMTNRYNQVFTEAIRSKSELGLQALELKNLQERLQTVSAETEIRVSVLLARIEELEAVQDTGTDQPK